MSSLIFFGRGSSPLSFFEPFGLLPRLRGSLPEPVNECEVKKMVTVVNFLMKYMRVY